MLLAAGGALAPAASADRTFAPRFSTTNRGQVVTAGNTVLTCQGTGTACKNAQAGTSTADNNDFDMDYVDVDSDSSTFNSSRATLALPSGSTVLFAGLYWAGDTSAGNGGLAAPLPAARSFVAIRTPTATRYSTITASVLDTDATSTTRYQGFADVTSQVSAAGNGVYTVGNIETGTGADRYGGWGLVVVYRNAAEPVRRLLVYDGLTSIQSGLRPTTDIALSGFVTPPSGTVVGRLGILAWEGDRGITGDSASFAGRSLTDALNPVTNVFNGTISRGGAYMPPGADEGRTLRAVVSVGGPGGTATATTDLSDPVQPAPGQPIPPQNTNPPQIMGSPKEGVTLQVERGTWTGTDPITRTYQWQRCNADGNGCVDIDGATALQRTTTTDDLGHRLQVVVTARNDAGTATATSALTAEITARRPDNTVSPAIAGTAAVGTQLSADQGTWTGTPEITYAYQWERCDQTTTCADIPGATDPTYTPGAADADNRLQVKVTATNGAGAASATSTPTARVTGAAPSNQTAPSVTGSARVGDTVAADPGTWTGAGPLTYDYRWQRCDAQGANCTDIAGATGASYTAVAADEGRTLKVVVTATGQGGNATKASDATNTVAAQSTGAPEAPGNTNPPVISGTTRSGSTLTASRAPGPAPRRSTTATGGSAATRTARTAPTSPARPRASTR
jgi:hypothetical protein